METSADKIRSVVKNLLPERPHHLSLYPDRKYPVPPNYWHHQSPLQYSTFISDADRGVLLTRPYFDICDEPDPSPVNPQPAVRTGPKKTLNKMSFKDYKKQKEKAPTSPMENGVPGKLEERRSHASAAKMDKEGLRKELDRSRESGSQRDSKAHDPRANGDSERYARFSERDRYGRCANPISSGLRAPHLDTPRETRRARQKPRSDHWIQMTTPGRARSQDRARSHCAKHHGRKLHAAENRTPRTTDRRARMVGRELLSRPRAAALPWEAPGRESVQCRPRSP